VAEPLVSVVTPVYNTEKYLSECIESVLRQSYTNWEYVILDNCSTDGSAEIARSYAARDPRIRVVSNSVFLPVIQNWNTALRQISSESKYCKVVHADDWLFPNCLSEMVSLMEAHPSVGLTSSYRLVEAKVTLDGLPYPSTTVCGREICRGSLLKQFYVFGSPTSLLMRCDLVRRKHDFYNSANLHADTEVCFELLRDSDFGFVHQVLTFTRRHNEATTSYARRLNTFLAGDLTCLVRYGPEYLSNEEYQQRFRRAMNGYYRFLARKFLAGKATQELWTYHRTELGKLGLKLDRTKLMRGCLAVLKERILNPAGTAEAIVARLGFNGTDRGKRLQPPRAEALRKS